MKAFLMHQDRDFEPQQKLCFNEQALVQDLELNTLFSAMALGDSFLFEVARQALLTGLHNDLGTILYRQNILKDCLKNPAIVREIYNIAVESIEKEKKNYWSFFGKYPGGILHRAVDVLQMFVGMLEKLRTIAEQHSDKFESKGFLTFFAMLKRELDEEYFARVQNHLKELKFPRGILISVDLGQGNKGTNYILRWLQGKKQGWLQRIFAKKPPGFTFYIADRDENGFRALSELKDRGINLVADAVARSTDHILSFFAMLRMELAFYIGCLNLHGQLAQMAAPVSFPFPRAAGERMHSDRKSVV